MRFLCYLFSLLFTIIGANYVHAISDAMPPPEPAEDHLVHEDVNIMTGLYYREYSLHNNGIVDYKTARQIIISEYNKHWNTVVHTKEYPLFYWFDANQNGELDMWVDRQVEGCLCDIVPYHATYE